MQTKKILVLSDTHIPYHDPAAVQVALQAIVKMKPAAIHLMGDIVDFYSVSNHQRDPDQRCSLQWELDQTLLFLQEVRKRAPKVPIILYEGNHETRLGRYLVRGGGELCCLRSLKLPSLLELNDLRITWRPEGQFYQVGSNFYLHHGVLLRTYAGYTAKGLIDRLGQSVGCGHTHRLATIHRRMMTKVHTAFENGCLCLLTPSPSNDFTKGLMDWQQGFSVLHKWKTKSGKTRVDVEQFLIVNGETRPFQP